ncbi:MAG: efflux transporter outer membrane subunit [Stenotrophobium sp.]
MKNTARVAAAPLALIGALVLGGCAVGPDFHTPAAPEVKALTSTALPAQTTATPGAEAGAAQTLSDGAGIPAQWWELFQSPKLNELITQALAANPTVASAQAALRNAQENLRASQAGFFPAVDAKAGVSRQRSSGASFGVPGGGSSIYNLYNASVGVSYTLDLFGGTRRAVEAQAAQVDYQRFELESTYLALAANTVTTALGAASLHAQEDATNDIITAQAEQLRVIRKQFELGAVSQAAVLAVEAQAAATQATLPPIQKNLAQTQNQLATYVGKFPGSFTPVDLNLADLRLPQQLPLSLPSELVRQRPDVRAAEALLHQASAGVGIATANLLPQITLSGSYGSDATVARGLFGPGAAIWSLGAGLVQPVFHAGQLTARRRAAIASYDKALADYKTVVAGAFQNVADVLVALDADANALKAQYAAYGAADSSLQLVQKQYQLGAVSYLGLLDAQRQYQQSRIAYVQAVATRYQDTAALFQALGGGWWNRAAADTQGKAAPQKISIDQ